VLCIVHINFKAMFIQYVSVLLLYERYKIIRKMGLSAHPEVVQRWNSYCCYLSWQQYLTELHTASSAPLHRDFNCIQRYKTM